MSRIRPPEYKEWVKAYNKAYHATEEHRARRRERDKDSLRSNPEKYRAYRTQWMKEKRDSDPVYRKKLADEALRYYYAHHVAGLRRNIKRGAKVRGYGFELSDAETEALIKSACGYCGKKPDPVIDRIDNSRGYVPGRHARLSSMQLCKESNELQRLQGLDFARSRTSKKGELNHGFKL